MRQTVLVPALKWLCPKQIRAWASLAAILAILSAWPLEAGGTTPSTPNQPDFAKRAEQVVSTLEQSDLPPRFEPAPPFLRQFILKGIAAVGPYVEKEGIAIDKVSTFVDFEQAEVVMGLTTSLSSRQAQEKFDTDLSRPDAREIFVRGLEESLQGVGKLKVQQVRELNSLEAIGNRARGFAFQANFQGLPLKLFAESVAFRRDRLGALVVAGALNHPLGEIRVRDLAARLDRRLSRAKGTEIGRFYEFRNYFSYRLRQFPAR